MLRKQYVMPDALYGQPKFPLEWAELNWLHELPKNTYFALWVSLPSNAQTEIQLPLGHPLYVISFHQERFDFEWVIGQAQKIDAPIVILCDGSMYNAPFPENVHFYNYHSWHYHLKQIISWFPNKQPRNIKYKVSNVCNRISQSKLIVFTALMEYLKRDELLVILNDWLEDKNVHNWQGTGNQILDQLTSIFREKYLGQVIKIDDFCQDDNIQSINSNPWQPLYTEAAIHVSGESFHYSLMHNEYGKIIIPGPSLSEKTFKCLVAGTPFIFVGQFECYNYLESLGLKFDYGPIDLSWDNDPGNLSRLTGIVDTIKSLANYSIADIVSMTQNSTEHNNEYIWSGKLQQRCQQHNEEIAQQVLTRFK